jgi:uncharacterized protein YbjQ (UPF0145 family)
MGPSKASKADLNLEVEPHSFTETQGVLTSTANDLRGYRVVKELGVIYGLNVRSRNWGADILSIIKSIAGGELKYLTNMLYTSRNNAVDRMIGECLSRGGNAVVGLRFDIAEVMNFSQVAAYGTAVIVEKEGMDTGVTDVKQ